MNVEQNSGKPARLSLTERAKQGVLLSEPDLALDEVLQLEHPGDRAARNALSRAIRAAIQYGDLTATTRQWQRPGLLVNRDWLRLPPLQHKPTQCSEHLLEREAYRQWRAQCPTNLLLPPPLSKIKKWLGDLARPESIPPVGTSLPERRQRQDALNHAIRAAIAVLSPSGDPLPQPRALFDYLRTADQTKTVIDSSKEQLTWYSAETGRKQTATIANLKRRLDRWID